MEERSAAVQERALKQKRILAGVTLGQLVGLILWVVAISTDHWTYVTPTHGSEVFLPKKQLYLLSINTGIWRTCSHAYLNKTKAFYLDSCKTIELFPEAVDTKAQTSGLMDQRRSLAAFSLISVGLMLLGLVFSVYTFKFTRYMFKRLAAGCNLITCGCTMTVLEVTGNRAETEYKYYPALYPKGTEWHFGYSYIIAWFTFVFMVVATVAFAVCSRKKKKDKAPDDQFALEEEPVIIGR